MPDIIGARCFTCGHVIRVPSNLGGRKAKCPKCAGIITIPTPWDSQMDIVSDDELPRVAEGPLSPEEEEEAAPPPPSSSATPRPRPGIRDRAARPGRAPHATPGTSRRPAPPGSSRATLIVGVAAGVAVLGIIVVVALATRSRGGDSPSPTAIDVPPVGPSREQREREAADRDVRARFDDYVAAYNECRAEGLTRFYDRSKNKEVVSYFNDLYTSTWLKYENVAIASLQAGRETATLDFTFDRILLDRDRGNARTEQKGLKRRTNWAKRDGAWVMIDAPEK